MARSKIFHFVLVAGAVMAATPALAQFGSIFRDNDPPRPPADVPNVPSGNNAPPYYAPSQPPPPPPTYYPSQDDRRYYPSGQQVQQPTYQQRQFDPNAPRPPADVRTGADDVPPSEPQPPPMSLPPSSRPGGGTIQSQDLAPPPGVQQAPAQQQPQPGQANTNPAQPAPAQAPGAPGAPYAPPQQPAQAPAPGQPQQPAAATPAAPGAPPSEEVVVEPPPERIANPTAVFAGLDKITGRIISFDVAINETVQFGALQVTPRVCYSRPPTETPQTDSFVEVDEVTLEGKIRRIFTGWMFAASPGLHAIEHPIYDVWLSDCKGGKNPAVADVSGNQADEPAKPAAKPNHAPVRHRPTRAQRNFPSAPPPLRQ